VWLGELLRIKIYYVETIPDSKRFGKTSTQASADLEGSGDSLGYNSNYSGPKTEIEVTHIEIPV
jgi:hypothetical protein